MALVDAASGNEGHAQRQLPNEDYTVGWICAVTTEYVAAQVFLDDEHAAPAYIAAHDNNDYTLGCIGKHNVAIAVLPGGEYGTASAAGVARDMLHTFPNIRIGLMVGIGGGAPSSKHDIRLGDVVVSEPQNGLGGVFQYDFGKNIQDQPFQSTRFLAPPPPVLLTALSGLRAHYEIHGHNIQESIKHVLAAKKRLRKKYGRPDTETDQLYRSDFLLPTTEVSSSRSHGSDERPGSVIMRPVRDEDDDDPAIHYGLIASANQLMKDAQLRDRYAKERGILCFEMEAGGLMNHFPCLVIRGICDYSETHKNKEWQGYAAMTAAAYAKDLLERISPNKVEAEKKLGRLIEDVASLSLDTNMAVQDLHTSNHFRKIIKWLSAPDPSTNLNKARELHQPGTGQWLLDSDLYRSWKADPGSFLWLYGIPGCGKTILSSTVITNLEEDTITSLNLLYFYFNFTDVAKRSTENAVRSLMDQLYRKSMAARDVLDSLYSKYEKSGRQPSHASLQKALQDMVTKCHDVYIVLDGLDECETRSQQTYDGVTIWVKTLRSSLPNVHILITSRLEDDIKSSIESWAGAEQMVPLQSDLVADDIGAYTRTKVEQMARWRAQPDIQKLIVTTLNERANGMFRWVACQLDVLQHSLSRKDVLRELSALPRTLDETYARIFERIYPGYKPEAIRLLQLLTYSERPLRLEEAVDALAIEPASKPRFDIRNRMPFPKEIARYCSSFIAMTEYKEGVIEIQLAHFSVQEYFQSDRLHPDLAPQFDRTAAAECIVELCLSYLLELNTSQSRFETAQRYPFAMFSAQYWSDYAAVVDSSNRGIPKALKEYYASESAFALGKLLYMPCYLPNNGLHQAHRIVDPLYYASFVGLLDSVHFLLKTNLDTNAQIWRRGNALCAASVIGHESIVMLLLENIAEVSGWHGRALCAASLYGHKDVAKLLIQYGAKATEDWDALQFASKGGHKDVVELLLQHGTDLNLRCRKGGNALITASGMGHKDVVQLLLQYGADVNAQGGMYINAFLAAAGEADEQIVKILHQFGAFTNAQSKHYRNVLHIDSFRRHITVAQLLLQHGADVNVYTESSDNALYIASQRGYTAIVDILLQNNADVNAQGGQYGNALQASSRAGHWRIVKMLLNKGANVNAQGGRYGNALQAASSAGCRQIVKKLLQIGACINVKGGKYGSAVAAASYKGHKAVVQLLLKSGAIIDAQGDEYSTSSGSDTE